jgi:hypothetical protein
MHFHVAAYAISPAGAEWNEKREGAFIDGIKELPFVAGIEMPHHAGFHRWDEDFFFRQADPAWTYVATALPSLIAASRETPGAGLAAVDKTAQKAAIDTVGAIRKSLRRLHDKLSRRAIRAVEIHSGPSNGRLSGTASAVAFADALSDIGTWDWDGAEIVVEHCDAAFPGKPIQKGFLSIEEEIEAIRIANARLNKPVGGSLNWGRSAIEAQSADVVPRHTALLQAAGLMRGMMFSGCSGTDTPYGVWQDTHMPHAKTDYVSAFADGSLLTEMEMRAFFAQTKATGLGFTGVKVAIRPTDADVPARLAMLRSALLVTASAKLATL